MQHRIFHKILVSILAICIIAPFLFKPVYADATNQQILDMLTSIRAQVVQILGTQRIGSTGNYDTIDYLQKMDTNLSLLDTRLSTIIADMTAAWDQTDPIQSSNYFESILNYFQEFYTAIGTENTRLYNIQTNTGNMLTVLQSISSDLDSLLVKIERLYNLDIHQLEFLNLFIGSDFSKLSWYANMPYFYSNNVQSTIRYQSRPDTTFTFIFFSSIINPVFNINGSDYSITYRYDSVDGFFLVAIDVPYPGSIGWQNITLSGNYKIYPLYFGSSTAIPNNLRQMIDEDFDDTYSRMLTAIYRQIYQMQNGTDQTESITGSNDIINNELNQTIVNYDNVESQFKTDFTQSMNQISKPGLDNIVSAAAWYTQQLTALFNAAGDFQIMYTLPLVLGLALFFIGRGALAYRESRTDVIESRTYDHELGDGSHYYKTYRQKRWK